MSNLTIHVIPAGGGSKCIHPGDTVGYNVLTKAMTGGSHSVFIADAVVGAAPPYHRHTADETFIILAPAGLEGFFDEVEALRAAGQHLNPERLATLAAPYGIEFLGEEPRF